jgi:GntR family transcriptional repressor for pyruvate dehydrogenase complex
MSGIKQQKLSDVITERLEAKILDGSFVAGEKLPAERVLSLEFNVSRPSLREAIQNLQAKGLVERKQGGGTYVSLRINSNMTEPLLALISQRPETQFDLLEFRHALEGMAAFYSALRGQPEDYQHLQSALAGLDEIEPTEDKEKEANVLGEFYLIMAKASHNMVLQHVMRSMKTMLIDNIQRNLKMLAVNPEACSEIAQQRVSIVAAIVQQNPQKARQASNAHLAFIEETLLNINQRDSRIQRVLRRIETNPS